MALIKAPPFEYRDFRSIFVTRLTSSMALNCQAVIVGWQVYKLKPDPLLLGLIGLAEAIPAISSSFVAGHVVDTNRPVSVYRWALFTMFLNMCLLWLAVWDRLPFQTDQRLVLLFVGVFISGAARSFASPSVYSLVPRIVPRNILGSAAAWNSAAWQFAAISGPALGGFAYDWFGPKIAFTIPVTLVAIGLMATFTFTPQLRHLKSDHEREPYFQSLKTGIKFAFGQKVLLSAMTLDMFSVLFGGAVAVLPMFADQIFGTGSKGLGFLRAAPSIGSAIVALYLAVRPMKTISGKVLLVCVAGFGLTMIGLALSPTFAIAFVFLVASGLFDGVSMVIRTTLLQLLTPDRMRGRIAALSSIFITSSNEIGAFESGLAARLLGLVPSVLAGGAMTLVVVGTTWLKVPALARTRIDQNA